jgi:hypothetical protein
VNSLLLDSRVLVALGLVGAIVYLVVVELGISAGRIHHGVSLSGVDVGGLNETEAVDRLEERAGRLEEAPIVVQGGGIERRLHPATILWRPRLDRSASKAMGVGRDGGLLRALGDRLQAWFGGVDIVWPAKAVDAKAVVAFMDGIEADAAELGKRLDRALLRRRIRTAITTWPREQVAIPLRP